MTAYLALGSNLGNRQETLLKAIALLEQHVGHVTAQSSFIETEPQGFHSPHRFLNACVAVETELPPLELLKQTQRIERLLGRTTKTLNGIYTDRTIDIDILLYGSLRLNTPQLTIPHPRMAERPFVLEPLSQIAPEALSTFIGAPH